MRYGKAKRTLQNQTRPSAKELYRSSYSKVLNVASLPTLTKPGLQYDIGG